MSEKVEKLEYVEVSGFPLTVASADRVLNTIAKNIEIARGGGVVSITNTESLYFAARLAGHAAYIRDAEISLCDGVGVVVAGLCQGRRVPRFNGPVFLERCCEHGLSRGWRHYFYGGKPGVAELLAQRLSSRFPGLVVAGTHSPPFRDSVGAEDGSILEMIKATSPDIIWVGLGLIKQESWIAANRSHLNAPWLVGVGAAFDFHAGTARWAPRWVQRIGLEWLYRLCFEPRMLSRNGRSFLFLLQALWRSLGWRAVGRRG